MKVAELKALPPTILVYAPAGRGKTALALTLGARCRYVDMDDNLEVAWGLRDEFREERLSVDVKQFLDRDPEKAVAFARAKRYIYDCCTECFQKKNEYKVFVLDSLTSLASAAQNMIMSNSGRLGENPEIQHWGMILTEIENVITRIRALPILAFILAHQTIFTSEDINEVQIAVPGQKLPGKITRMFNEIWYLRLRAIGEGKTMMYIQTVPSPMVTCRSGRGLQTGIRIGTIDKKGNPVDSVGLWSILDKIKRKETEPMK